MFRPILTFALVLGLSALAPGQEKKADRPKPDPEGTPLELTITGKTTTFTLDTGGLSAADFKKKIEDTAKAGGRLPTAPAVDLTVEVKNTSDKPLKVWAKGDPVVLTLELKGKGAVNIDPPLPMTLEFRIPEAVEVAAGKTHEIPLKSLVSGKRMSSHFSYWTEPGGYELVATLRTGVSPAPKGAKEGMDGFGIVTLTSPPLKLTVETKK